MLEDKLSKPLLIEYEKYPKKLVRKVAIPVQTIFFISEFDPQYFTDSTF